MLHVYLATSPNLDNSKLGLLFDGIIYAEIKACPNFFQSCLLLLLNWFVSTFAIYS
jgi:hypothetical protein